MATQDNEIILNMTYRSIVTEDGDGVDLLNDNAGDPDDVGTFDNVSTTTCWRDDILYGEDEDKEKLKDDKKDKKLKDPKIKDPKIKADKER